MYWFLFVVRQRDRICYKYMRLIGLIIIRITREYIPRSTIHTVKPIDTTVGSWVPVIDHLIHIEIYRITISFSNWGRYLEPTLVPTNNDQSNCEKSYYNYPPKIHYNLKYLLFSQENLSFQSSSEDSSEFTSNRFRIYSSVVPTLSL